MDREKVVAAQASETSGPRFFRGLHRRMVHELTSTYTSLGARIHPSRPEAFRAMIVCGVWGAEVERRRG